MSSIPLPALHTAPIEPPPSPLQMYGQMMGLQNAQQELRQRQAMAPLEQQAAQQQVQSGAMGLQNQQMQMDSNKAVMQSFAHLDPNDPNYFATGMRNAQASGKVLPQTLQELMQAGMKFRTQALAQTKAQQEIQANAGDQLHAIGSEALQMPDDKLADAWPTIRQKVLQVEGVDPTQAASAVPEMFPGRDWLLTHTAIAGMSAAGMRAAAAQQQAGTAAATGAATLQQKQAETDFYRQNGGAPGVPVNAREMSDWLQKNPGKGPSDYQLWSLQHSPMAVVMGNQFTPGATELAAQNLLQTGTGPQGMYRSPGTTAAVYNKAAELNATTGAGGIAASKATYQADAGSLRKLQSNYDQVQAFENTAQKNMDLLQQTAQKIPDLGARFANVPVRMITSKMIGSENMAAFHTALGTAQTEAAKVLTSSNASGVLSDNARHELQEMIDGNMPYGAMVASLNTLKQDMANRTAAYQNQIREIQGRLKAPGQPAQSGGNGPAVGTVENGYRFTGGDPGQPSSWKKVQP